MRDSRAGYFQSLEVLRAAKDCGVFTKSSLMLGLGEEDSEVIDAMLDLRDAGKQTSHCCLVEMSTWLITSSFYFMRAFTVC